MDFGTPEQIKRGGRIMLGTKRGEVDMIFVLSVFDQLLDYGLITEAQKSFGDAYWRLKQVALPALNIAENPIYGSVYNEPDPDAIAEESEGQSVDGATTEIWIILNGMLRPEYRNILNACCRTADECPATAIVQAFGINSVTNAFEALEEMHPKAGREFENRVK